MDQRGLVRRPSPPKLLVMYLLLTLLLVLLAALLVFWKGLRPWRRRYPEFTNFLLTLIATFIGVLLAIDLSSRVAFRTEQAEVIRILEATRLDLGSKHNSALAVLIQLPHERRPAGDTTRALPPEQIAEHSLFQQMTTNYTVLRHLSPYGIQNWSRSADRLATYQRQVNELSDQQDLLLMRVIRAYTEEIAVAEHILATETRYLQGELDAEAAKASYLAERTARWEKRDSSSMKFRVRGVDK